MTRPAADDLPRLLEAANALTFCVDANGKVMVWNGICADDGTMLRCALTLRFAS